MKIEHVGQLAGHKACAFAIETNHQLISLGLASAKFPMVNWDDGAFIALIDEQIVGIVTFFDIKWRRELAIKLGYVEHKYRNAGIYRKLWQSLVDHGRTLEYDSITGVTYTSNKPMRDVAKRLGRVEESINLSFNLRKD